VSYKLAFIVVTEIIVVSDIGDKLSPKKLPHTIAPNISAGLQFIEAVNGKKIGTAIEIVPVDVPMHVDIMQQIINIIAGKNFTLIPAFIDSIKNAFDIPVSFNILDKIPANIKIKIQVNNELLFKLFTHFSPNFFLSFVSTYDSNIEKNHKSKMSLMMPFSQ
jgi:hypothetical protein